MRGIVVLAGIFSLLVCGCTPHKEDLTIYFAGDMLLDRGVRCVIDRKGVPWLFADSHQQWADADAVVVNLECPVTTRQSPIHKRFRFRAEPEWLAGVRKAGVTHLVMANNHTNDQGRAGMTDTRNHIITHGMVPVGYGNSQAGACVPTLINKNGYTVALFSSVPMPLESWPYLPDSTGICQMSPADMAVAITTYKQQHPTHYVVAILHWGAEYQPMPAAIQRQQAAQLVAAGADAIVGHHPHVVVPMTLIAGKPVYFSIGNFIFDHDGEATSRGLLVRLHFDDKGVTWSSKPYRIKHCVPHF